MTELETFEQTFRDEHEATAQDGWPGFWADRPVLKHVMSWPDQSRSEFWKAGNKTFHDYLTRTAKDYRRHLDGSLSWSRFLDRTAAVRARFQNLILAAHFEKRPA